jgi:hypothetical protein
MAAQVFQKNLPAAMRLAPVPPRVSSGRDAAYRGKRLEGQEKLLGAVHQDIRRLSLFPYEDQRAG